LRNSLILKALALSLFLALLTGCSGKSEPQKKPAPPVKIGVTLALPAGHLEEVIKKAMEKQAKQEKIQLIWKSETDPAAQRRHLDEMAKEQVKAVIAGFGDPLEAPALGQQVAGQGVPLIVLGPLAQDTAADAWISINPAQVGELVAGFVARELQTKPRQGEILILESQNYQPLQGEIAGAITEAMAVRGIEARQIKTGGADLPATMLTKPAAVVTVDPLLTETLLSSQVPPEILTVGIGGGPASGRAIQEGRHDAEVDIRPDLLAREALRAALDLNQNGQWNYQEQVRRGAYYVPARYCPVRLITSENATLLEQVYGKPDQKQETGGGSSSKGSGNSGGGSGSSEGDSGSSGQAGSSAGGGSPEEQGQKIIIKIEGGQQMEINVPGRIEGIEISPAQKGP